MSRAQKTTTVRMPADKKLHPAHVVAIRPDVEGIFAKRGDYVLTVQTPAGTRNVVMPADGCINLHVSLMQEVEPKTELFSVAQMTVEPTSSFGENDTTRRRESPSVVETKRAAADGTSRSDKAGWGIITIAFCLLALVLAAFLPGVVFGLFESALELSGAFIGVALGVALFLLVSIWLLSKPGFLSSRAIGGRVASVSVMIFAGLLALGIQFPQVRDIQKSICAPVASFAIDQLQLFSDATGIAGFWPTTAAQTVISLPADDTFSGDLFDPQIGEVILVGFDFCPRGWAQADGQVISIAQNTALFSLYGTNYGGDGRTTFALPDLRGRAPSHLRHRNRLGQRFGHETSMVARGADKMQIGIPHLAMTYCIALSGTFPSRS